MTVTSQILADQNITNRTTTRWYVHFTLLILFNLMAVSMGLFLSKRSTDSYKASIVVKPDIQNARFAV